MAYAETARKAFVIFVARNVTTIVGVASLYLVAHRLGAEVLGTYAFCVSFVGIFSFFLDFGFHSSHIKRVSEGQDLSSCISTFLFIKSILIIATVAVVISALNVAKMVRPGFQGSGLEPVISVYLLAVVIENLSWVAVNTFNARKESAKEQSCGLVSLFTGFVFILVAVFYIKSAFGLALAQLAGAAAALIYVFILFRHYPIGRLDIAMVRSYFSFAAPLMLLSCVSVVGEYFDKIFIRIFWDSSEVGYYYAAQRVVSFLMALSGTVQMLIFPMFSALHMTDDIDGIRTLTWKSERYISLLISPILMVLVVFGDNFIELIFGKKFLPVLPMLYAMVWYVYFASVNRPSASQILGVGRPKAYVMLSIALMAFGISLSFLFVPSSVFGIRMLGLGGFGAALVMAIAGFIGLVGTKLIVYRLTGTRLRLRVVVHPAVAILVGAGLALSKHYLGIHGVWQCIALSALGVAVYLGLLSRIGEMRPEDLRYLSAIANPAKLKEYVSAELRSRPML